MCYALSRLRKIREALYGLILRLSYLSVVYLYDRENLILARNLCLLWNGGEGLWKGNGCLYGEDALL